MKRDMNRDIPGILLEMFFTILAIVAMFVLGWPLLLISYICFTKEDRNNWVIQPGNSPTWFLVAGLSSTLLWWLFAVGYAAHLLIGLM